MIYSTATVAVNPHGETVLTREQAWKGLESKARDARLFLPPGLCTRCDVVEQSATHFVREATIGGTDLREIITLEPQRKVTFFQAPAPAKARSSTNCSRTRPASCSCASTAIWACAAKRPTARKSRPSRRSSTAPVATGRRCCRRCVVPVNCSRRTRCALTLKWRSRPSGAATLINDFDDGDRRSNQATTTLYVYFVVSASTGRLSV
jgi:hypothetical protein